MATLRGDGAYRSACWLGGNKQVKVDPTAVVELRISLRIANETVLANRLREVSEPSSPFYGQHLSRREVRELISPPADQRAAVRRWFARPFPPLLEEFSTPTIAMS